MCGLGAFDAVLAAAVLGRDHLTTIASADRSFAAVPGLRFVDLSDNESLAALGLGGGTARHGMTVAAGPRASTSRRPFRAKVVHRGGT